MVNKKFLSAAALGLAALAPVAGQAQVVQAVSDLIADTNENVGATISSIAANSEEIDGSIDIDVDGQAGGALSASLEAARETSEALEGNLDLEGSAAAGSVLGDLAGAGAAEATLDLDIEQALAERIEGTLSETANATSVDIGNLEATALGGVNNGTLDFSETGALIESASDSASSSTSAAASYASNVGSGLNVEEIATNTAEIMGNVDVDFAGNGSIGNVATTAAGAINTSELVADIVGSPGDGI